MWLDDGMEEGVIPPCWIKNNKVMWPTGMNERTTIIEQREPGDKWLQFKLVKIRFRSGNSVNLLNSEQNISLFCGELTKNKVCYVLACTAD